MKKLILSVSLLVIQFAQAQTWNLLIPSTSYDGTKLNFSGSGYNRSENKIYSLFWNAQGQLITSNNVTDSREAILNTKNISSGFYFVDIIANGQKDTYKVQISH